MTDLDTKFVVVANATPTSHMVSVVIPAYNAVRYLRDAIGSAVTDDIVQEVIVVDDGSTDGTAVLLRELAEFTPKLIVISQPNQGVSVARNSGLRAVTTLFTCFLDADDVLQPGGLAELHRLLVVDRTASAAYGQIDYIDEQSRPLQLGRACRSAPTINLHDVLQKPFIDTTGALLIRTQEISMAGGFDPALRCAQDWEFYTRLVLLGPIVGSERGVVLYRQHAQSTMHAARLDLHHFEPAVTTVFSPVGPGVGRVNPATLKSYEWRMRASILRRLGHRRQSAANHLRVVAGLHWLLRKSGYDRAVLTLLSQAILTAGKRIILRA